MHIDDALLRAAKVTAARTGKREYEVFEDAQREHLGLAGVVERIWSGIDAAHAPDEDEADRFAAAELAAVRAGERFLVTRNGEPVAEIRPVAPGRDTFIPRERVARMAAAAVRIDRHQFRADLDRVIDQDVT